VSSSPDLAYLRSQPMTRSFFLDTILSSVYGPEGPHPHNLAVLLSTLAVTKLFDEEILTSSTAASARECHQAAYACLVAGKFYTNTTLSSLVSLQQIGTFMLNSDDRHLPDGNFAVYGLAIRLAIIAGYHRGEFRTNSPMLISDPATIHRPMNLEEMDMRRRIWHELLASDRLHVSLIDGREFVAHRCQCLPALLPNSIGLSHYDTKLPSDTPPQGYFIYKWKVGVQISRVVDYWTSTTIPPDTGESTCAASTDNPQCSTISTWAFESFCTASLRICAATSCRYRHSPTPGRAPTSWTGTEPAMVSNKRSLQSTRPCFPNSKSAWQCTFACYSVSTRRRCRAHPASLPPSALLHPCSGDGRQVATRQRRHNHRGLQIRH
jgi:hypothetical protein